MFKKIILILFTSFTFIKSNGLNSYDNKKALLYQKQLSTILNRQDKIAPFVKVAGFAIGTYATFKLAKSVFTHLGFIGNSTINAKQVSVEAFEAFAKTKNTTKSELISTLNAINQTKIDDINEVDMPTMRKAYLADCLSSNILLVGDKTTKGFYENIFHETKQAFLWTVGLGGILGFDQYFINSAQKILMKNYYIGNAVRIFTDCMQTEYDLAWFFDRHVKWYHDLNNLKRACIRYQNLTQRVDNTKSIILKKYADNADKHFEEVYQETALREAVDHCENIKIFYNMVISDAEKIIGFMIAITLRSKDSDMYETILNETKFAASTIKEALSNLNIQVSSLLNNKCRNLSDAVISHESINQSVEIINERINSFNQLLK